MSHPASVLFGLNGERVALCDCSISAVLRDLLAEVTVTQTYRNGEAVNIEAVYTFPLPLDAVLLDFSVTLGERKLQGTVVPRNVAEERYEDAVAAGNAAVMLEQLEPGVYTMNVGSLLANETAVITFTYAVLYRWAGDNLRMQIPTTIAPRYGEAPFAPHQTPEFSMMVENQFSLEVAVVGTLRDAMFECPSHDVTLASSPDRTLIRLSQTKATMDRDFILNVKAPQANHSFALCGADRTGDDGRGSAAVVAAYRPSFPSLGQPRPLNLVVVIDCSGSMQGDSMRQAKDALVGILDGLQPRDRITIVAFGNTTKALFDQPRPCTDANLRQAREFVSAMEADMGGTEIGRALQAAYAATRGSEGANVLLVTDGEVSEWKSVVANAKTSGSRIFTVGVGHAVSEGFVREVAAVTGGECELVSPREGMADRVVRHFERMRAPRAKRVVVHWPEGARNQAPTKVGSVFAGDTVFVSAQFDRPSVTGLIVVEIETESGHVVREELAIGQAPAPEVGGISAVARIAAMARIKELDQEPATQTAVEYQLASQWTSWLVVAERPEGEKTFEIPAIRKVPQTLAAGWGGVGIALQSACIDDRAELSASFEASPNDRGDDALRLEAWLGELGSLLQSVHRLDHDFAAMADDTRGALQELLRRLETLIARVMSESRSTERRAGELTSALEALGREPGVSQHLDAFDAVLETRARLAEIHERLLRMREVVMHLERCQKVLSEGRGLFHLG